MRLAHQLRKLAAKLGVEAFAANPMSIWRCRLPALLERQGFDLVLDVGANDGAYAAELLENGYRGRIVSFEPQPQVHEGLRRRAARIAPDRWRVHDPVALSDELGEATFHEAGNSVSSSLLPMCDAHLAAAPSSALTRSYTVRTERLDRVLAALDCGCGAFLKMDVQGAEHLVMAGAGDALAGPIRGVQIELSVVELYEGQFLAGTMDEWLQERGFVLWDIVPGFRDPATLRLLSYDGIYLRV